jgi:hypothetical protein
MSTASNAAIIAAVAAQQREAEEEEEMTKYKPEDLNGWEFKILRSNQLGGFKNKDVLKAILFEEAENGWELVEKFDEYRLRLKRKTTHRTKPSAHAVDEYRTTYGASSTVAAIIIFAVTLFLVFLLATTV